MKKLLIILLLGCWGFVACDKTPDPVDEPNRYAELIVGSWNMDVGQSMNYDELITPDGTSSDQYSVLESGIESEVYDFRADGSLVATTVLGPSESYVDNYSYKVQGDSLIIFAEPLEAYRVVTLDDHALVIEGDGTISGPGTTYNYRVHYVFSR